MQENTVIPQSEEQPAVIIQPENNTVSNAVPEKKEEPSSPNSANKMKRAEFLGNGPLVKTIWSLTYPDFIAKLVAALYNLVDSMFIGQYAGSTVEEKKLALAGVSLVSPVEQCLLVGFSLIFAQGGGPLYGRYLGKHDEKTSRRIIGNTFCMDVLLGIVMAIILPLICDPLLNLLGASEAAGTLSPARKYILPLMYGDILYNFCYATNNLMRGEGAAMFSCSLMIISAATNIICDFFLLTIFNVGVSGAAYSTLIAYTCAVSFGLWYFISKRSAVSVRCSDLIPDWKLVCNMMNVGLSGMVIGLANGILSIACNQYILHFSPYAVDSAETTAAIAASGSLVRMQFFMFIPVNSIAHGVVALIAYCRGAALYKRFMSALKVCFIGQFIVSLVVGVLCFTFAENLAGLFNNDADFITIFSKGLRYMSVGVWLCPFSCTLFPGLQAIGQGFSSAFVLLNRSCLSIIIVQFIMCYFRKDYWGVFMAYPIAEALSAVVACCFFFYWRKDMEGVNLPVVDSPVFSTPSSTNTNKLTPHLAAGCRPPCPARSPSLPSEAYCPAFPACLAYLAFPAYPACPAYSVQVACPAWAARHHPPAVQQRLPAPACRTSRGCSSSDSP